MFQKLFVIEMFVGREEEGNKSALTKKCLSCPQKFNTSL